MDIWTIYAAGLLSFFSPCVLPIIPVYFSIFMGTEDHKSWKKVLPKGLLFCAGFSAVFAALGLGAGKISTLIMGNRSAINLIAGMIILFVSLKLMNVITIPFLDRSYSVNVNKFKTRFGLLNAFILGLLFAAIWSPCIGPVLGSILTYISTKAITPFNGASYLLAFSTGISTPLILSVFFFQPLMNFIHNNKYFVVMLQKVLGIVLLLFAINLFADVIKLTCKMDTMMSQETEKILKPDKRPVFISMISLDCEICQEMLPIIKKLKDGCDGEVVDFRTIDIGDPKYANVIYRLEMIGTPTYVLIGLDGKESARMVGYNDSKTIDQEIFKLTGKNCLKTK